jgi:hypothetical protein
MYTRFISWFNVILTPVSALIVAADYWAGTPHWYVWAFAFIGMLILWVDSLSHIIQPNTAR